MRKELKSLSFNQTLDKTSSKHLDNSFHNTMELSMTNPALGPIEHKSSCLAPALVATYDIIVAGIIFVTFCFAS